MSAAAGIMYRMLPPDDPGQDPVFEPVDGIDQATYDLQRVGDELLAASSLGIFSVQDAKASLLSPAAAACIYPSPYQEDILYVGLATGMLVMKFLDGRWQQIGLVNELKGDFRTIVEVAPGELWTGTYPGFVHIQLDMEPILTIKTAPPSDHPFPTLSAQIKTYTSFQGSTLGDGNVYLIDNKLVLSDQTGLFSLDPVADTLVLDAAFFEQYPHRVHSPFLMYQDREKDVWVEGFLEDEKIIGWFRHNAKGQPEQVTAPFFRLDNIETVFDMYQQLENQQFVWFAGDNGLVSFDKEKAFETKPRFKPLIRQLATLDDSILFGGVISQKKALHIPYSDNALRFSFGFPAYDGFEKNQFQYKLEGFDKSWSPWSAQKEKEYTNLPEGSYSFQIRGKNSYQEIIASEPYSFRILPPWYRTLWAYLGYSMLAAISLWLLLRWRTRRLQAQNRALEAEVRARTAEVLTAREQLIVQERLASLGQMTAGIAHEIKNPLNFVTNFAKGNESLLEEMEEEMAGHWGQLPQESADLLREIITDIKENSLSISKHGRRADNIINSMMQHAEGSSGQRMPADINRLLLDNLSFSMQGHGGQERGFNVMVEQQLAEKICPKSMSFPREISRVFLNICSKCLVCT
ncbi:MAG: triple tyrosine motif-containing protein [Bacteroidia bacterium]